MSLWLRLKLSVKIKKPRQLIELLLSGFQVLAIDVITVNVCPSIALIISGSARTCSWRRSNIKFELKDI